VIRHEAYSRLEVLDKEPNREVIMLSDLQFRVFGPYEMPTYQQLKQLVNTAAFNRN
jgi:hypothetical protein